LIDVLLLFSFSNDFEPVGVIGNWFSVLISDLVPSFVVSFPVDESVSILVVRDQLVAHEFHLVTVFVVLVMQAVFIDLHSMSVLIVLDRVVVGVVLDQVAVVVELLGLPLGLGVRVRGLALFVLDDVFLRTDFGSVDFELGLDA
jgi:hypothetical protein